MRDESVNVSTERIHHKNIWTWKSCRCDGCRDCSQLTISTNVRPLQGSVWQYSGNIWIGFCSVLEPWMKHGSITISRENNQSKQKVSTGDRPPQASAGQSCHGDSFWGYTKGISHIDYRQKVKPPPANYIIESFWTDLILILSKNYNKGRRKECCSIETVHGSLMCSLYSKTPSIRLRTVTPSTILSAF